MAIKRSGKTKHDTEETFLPPGEYGIGDTVIIRHYLPHDLVANVVSITPGTNRVKAHVTSPETDALWNKIAMFPYQCVYVLLNKCDTSENVVEDSETLIERHVRLEEEPPQPSKPVRRPLSLGLPLKFLVLT